MPDTGLSAKGAALNTTCTVPVLKGFLSSGGRLSAMNFFRAENRVICGEYMEGIWLILEVRKSLHFSFFNSQV